MRTFLILWLTPIAFLGLWYGLSANDIHLGTTVFSRETHDRVFDIYATILGIDADLLPGLLARTLAFDCGIVALIIAYKKRAVLVPAVRQMVR